MTQSSSVIESSLPMLDVEFTLIDIVDLRMATVVSEIHLEVFHGYLNARLGRGYTRALIQWYVKQEDAIALAAIDRNHQIIGYAIGGPVSLAQKLSSDMFWVTARSIVLHPWVALDKRLWKVAQARFTPKHINGKIGNRLALAEPTFSLRGIGVKSSHQGKGVGKLLLHAFEERAKILRAKSLVLWVYSDKAATRRLYERCGWRPFPGSIQNTGSIKYVRMLDQPYS
ncbi:MAG: GNAT family N-acetyltransferase [Nitrospira sp.]|nr:GNAT family N-acetyltransferase [Nitrospira sp.]